MAFQFSTSELEQINDAVQRVNNHEIHWDDVYGLVGFINDFFDTDTDLT